MTVPREVAAYSRNVAEVLALVFRADLVGVYLHGSGAMGGWERGRSDVDLLAVTSRTASGEEKRAVAAKLTTPALPAPGAGLEFSLVSATSFAPLSARPPFELHIATGAGARAVDGAGHPGDADLVLHYAVCREGGVAVVGPPAKDVLPEVPRAMVVAGLEEELTWAREHAPPRYQVLNALRAWAYADSERLLSKFEAVGWAGQAGQYGDLAKAAWAAQEGGAEPSDHAAIARLLADAIAALRAAQ